MLYPGSSRCTWHARHYSVCIPRSVGYRRQHDAGLSVACGTMGFTMTMLFFDQFDSQVGVIGILAGPAGVREVGWRLDPRGASIEPDETVQMALGQLREYFAGQRRD